MNKEETLEEEKKEEEIKEEPVEEKPKKEKKKKENKEIEKLKEELKEKDDKILRLSAEFQNMRRRNEEERTKLLKYDGEKFIVDILPILDNFEHAVLMDDANLTDEVSKFLSGFKMIYGNLVDILNKNEIKEIDCLHQEFDETTFVAVLVDSTDEFDDNVVIDVLQKGYMYKDKVIRPAMVKVNHKEEGGSQDG